MYPELDEAIYEALRDSTEQALKPFKILLPGSKKLDPHIRSIMVGNSSNTLEVPGDDFDGRRVGYSILINIQKLGYLEARKQLRTVRNAVIRTLYTSLSSDYTQYMKVEDIIPEYGDNFVLKQEEIQISFLVDEDYGEEEAEIDEIKTRGEL